MALLYDQLFELYVQEPSRLEAELSSDVAIHENFLDDAKKLSSISSKWNCLKAIAETKYREQKLLIKEVLWPQACLSAHDRLKASDGKAAQYLVEWHAYRDPTYASAASTLRKYGHILDMVKGVQASLWDKKDMLKTFGRDERQERGDNSISKIETQEVDAPWGPSSLPAAPKPKLTSDELEALARDAISKSKNRS